MPETDAAELMKGDHLLLVFDKENFQLQVHGNVASNDMALAILAQASRVIENEVKIALAMAAQQKLREQAEAGARVNKILSLTGKH